MLAEFDRVHRERLISYLRSLGATPADAEAIAAEVFSQAAAQWASIRDHSWRWLAVVAKSTYLRHRRSRNQHVHVDELAELPEFNKDPASTLAGELLNEIRYFSPTQREILALCVYGYSSVEIGEMLGICPIDSPNAETPSPRPPEATR